MGRINEYGIILVFALLHSAVSIVARIVGFHELFILTMLTMYMSLVLSLHMKMSVPFVFIAVVMITFVGMWIGEPLGVMARKIFPPTPLRHHILGSICNFITTWIIGLMQVGCAVLFRKSKLYRPLDTKGFIWMIVPVIIVLIVRLVMTMDTYSEYYLDNMILNVVLSCSCSMIMIIIMAGKLMNSIRKENLERRKGNQAKYSYEMMKRQIEPHFLFNSLNSLISIVEANEKEKAITFIHKLSGIYRYITDNEPEVVVPLSEELELVNGYADLMKVRFPEGLEIVMDIESENRCVIPCSLQLLVENAIKHNVISCESPLRIDVSIEGEYMRVSNNRNRKQTSVPSGGNGLNYIRNRYLDETGKNIIIIDNDEEYTVKIPLI